MFATLAPNLVHCISAQIQTNVVSQMELITCSKRKHELRALVEWATVEQLGTSQRQRHFVHTRHFCEIAQLFVRAGSSPSPIASLHRLKTIRE
jgi:hypothetical protein